MLAVPGSSFIRRFKVRAEFLWAEFLWAEFLVNACLRAAHILLVVYAHHVTSESRDVHIYARVVLPTGSPVLEPVGLVNMQSCHLDPNEFRHRITWPTDDYLQVTCMYLGMPKPPQWPYAPARK